MKILRAPNTLWAVEEIPMFAEPENTTAPDGTCRLCGGYGHGLFRCPKVLALEFHEDGSLRRIEYVPEDTQKQLNG